MQQYRLIALDMDGTVLMSDMSIHPDTVRDIRYAAGLGIPAVFCSGRGLAELTGYLEQLSTIRYAVCMSGAMVYDFGEQRAIELRAILPDLVREVLRTADRYDAMPHLLTETESILPGSQACRLEEYHKEACRDLYRKTARCAGDIAAEAQSRSIAKVNLYFRSEEDREKGYRELQHLPLNFVFTEEATLEMNAAGVSKAQGLAALTEHLGIGMAEVIAIGDADNDVPMLQSAGFAVAMGNAPEEIRAICDYVTADNDHNGVGRAIRHICGLTRRTGEGQIVPA